MKPLVNKILLFLLNIGLALVLVSLPMDHFKDEAYFEEQVQALYLESQEDSSQASQAYFELFAEEVTLKYKLVDYGLSLVMLAAILYVFLNFFVKQGQILTPKKRIHLLAISFFASLLTAWAYASHYLIGAARRAYAPWADIIAIPLMSTPFIAGFGFLITGISALFITKNFNTSNFKLKNDAHHLTWGWRILLVPSFFLAAFLMVVSSIGGEFMSLLAFAVWTLFFFYLAASKRSKKRPKKGEVQLWQIVTSFLAVPTIHFLALATGGYTCNPGQTCIIWMDNLSHAFAGIFFVLLIFFFSKKHTWAHGLGFALFLALLWELAEWLFSVFFTDLAYQFSIYSPSVLEAAVDVASNMLGALIFLLYWRHLNSRVTHERQ